MMKECSLKKPCSCGYERGVILPSENNTHAGKIHCGECFKFLKWLSKSEFDRAKQLNLVNEP